jgi:hypothetical protein
MAQTRNNLSFNVFVESDNWRYFAVLFSSVPAGARRVHIQRVSLLDRERRDKLYTVALVIGVSENFLKDNKSDLGGDSYKVTIVAGVP